MKIFTSHVIFEIASFYIQQIHIFESENLQNMHFIMLILNKSVLLLLLQLSYWGASRSTPRQDFLTPWKAIVEWGQSNCNTSKSTFTFVRLVSRHCARMRQSLQKSGESESSVMMVLGKIMLWEYVNELHICQIEVEKTMLWNYCTEDFSKKYE